jgi:hypothetical protein
VSDEKDTEDGSDWLSSQFDTTGKLPTQPAAAPPPTMPPASAPPPATVPAPAPVAPTAPVAPAPAPNSGGGFNWGLKPGGVVDPPPVATPAVPSAPPVPAPVPAPVPSPVSPPIPSTPPPLINPPTEQYPSHAAPPTPPPVSEPTKPLSWDEFAATQQAATAPPAPEQPTEAYTVQPWQPAAATSPSFPLQHSDEPGEPTSAIDSLFGDHKFQDYEEVGVLKTIQVPPSAGVEDATQPREPREPLPKSQKVLLGVAAGLLAALILVGLFFFGQHLGSAAADKAKAVSTNASTTTPTPAGTGGPVDPGVQQWTALQGGECIQPFTSAWALTFTVVACTADHDAEMVFKGTLPDTSDAKYPNTVDFQKEITPLCSASTAINYAAAASVTDLQVSFSYPPTTARWLSGDRTYYCFVDRVSGGNLPGDLSVPKASK